MDVQTDLREAVIYDAQMKRPQFLVEETAPGAQAKNAWLSYFTCAKKIKRASRT